MPKGISKNPDITSRKKSELLKKRWASGEMNSIMNSLIGHPNYLLHHTEEAKKKIGLASKRMWQNQNYRDKMRKRSGGMLGKRHSNETKEMISLKKTRKPNYRLIHRWITRKMGKANRCEICNRRLDKFQWANISGNYIRRVDDWKQLCLRCHKEFDAPRRGKIKKIFDKHNNYKEEYIKNYYGGE